MQLADGTQIVRSPRSDTAMQQPAHLRHTQRTAQTASETGTAEEASETLSDPGASGELLASSRPMGLGGHALLLLALLSGSAVGLLFFSLLGYGVEVYRALASVDWWLAPSLVVGALLLLVALYALDARYWKGAGRIAAYFPLLAAAAGSLGAACLLGTKQYPYAPLLCVFLVPTLGVWLLRRAALPAVPPRAFFVALSAQLLLLAVAVSSSATAPPDGTAPQTETAPQTPPHGDTRQQTHAAHMPRRALPCGRTRRCRRAPRR